MKTKNVCKVAFLGVLVAMVGFVFQACNETKPLTQDQMEGYWVLKTIKDQDAKTVFAGALPTLQFDFEKNMISGTGGCNRYTGAFSYKDNILSASNLVQTQMLCAEDNLEGEFILALTNTNNTLSLVDGLLCISHDGKVILEFEKGKAPKASSINIIDPDGLSGVWELKDIDGVQINEKFSGEHTIPTLSFDIAEGKLSGHSGCNRFNGTFSLSENQLVVGPLMSTKMACPNLESEARFLQAISDTSMINMPNADILQFAKNGTVLLVLEKQLAENKK